MKKLFTFERKIGWPELLSFAAFLISVVGYLQLREQVRQAIPDIFIEKRDPLTGGMLNEETGNARLAALHTFRISNRGGRAVSLVGLRPNQLSGWIGTAALASGSQFIKDVKLEPRFFIAEGAPPSPERLGEFFSTHGAEPLESLALVNISLDAGQTKILNLGVLINAYRGKKRLGDTVIFSVDLLFSDGTTHELGQAYRIFDYEEIGKGH
jgi:hypothetical protein